MVQLGVVSGTCSSATASLFSGLALVCILLGHANLQPFPGIYPLDSACSSSSVQLGPLSLLGIAPPVQLGSTLFLLVLACVQPELASVQLGLHSPLCAGVHLCSVVRLGQPHL